MKKIILIFPLLLFILPIEAQTLQQFEEVLNDKQKMLFRFKKDAQKDSANAVFQSTLEKALTIENSFEFPFDSLKEIGRLTSPDKKFRIINWNLVYSNGDHKYFGFMQVYDTKTKKYSLLKMNDKSDEIKNPENYTGSVDKWYGMLYYSVVMKKSKKRTCYTLFGWDGNNGVSSRKIIDVLTFASDGKPRFGESIFSMPRKSPRRVLFEYNSEIVMSLKYDEARGMIVFDHLSPRDPSLQGQFQFYGPDFTYDGFSYKKGKWIFVENVEARNAKNKGDKYYLDPKGNDRKQPRVLYDTTKVKKVNK